MPRRESESQISPTAGTTSAVSTGPRRGRSRSPRRYRRLLRHYDRSDSSSDSSGSERSWRDRRHRRRRKSCGRSRSRGHRRHRRRRSRDTETSSESDSDDDDSETSYESEGSRDRKSRRSKRHKSSKRGRKSSSRKTRKGGSRRKRRRRSDSEDSGTPDRATANAKSGNVAKDDVAIRYRGTAEARSQAVIGATPLPRVEAAQARYGGALRPGEGDAAEERRRALAEFVHEQKARREDLRRIVDMAPAIWPTDDPFTLRAVHES